MFLFFKLNLRNLLCDFYCWVRVLIEKFVKLELETENFQTIDSKMYCRVPFCIEKLLRIQIKHDLTNT